MIAVLTGDIVQSSQHHKDRWLPALKAVLADWGSSPTDWEVYRGDEFQLLLNRPEDALLAAFRIKAHLKAQAETDIRIAIGIGEKEAPTTEGPGVSEAGGTAFIYSGRKLDEIKKERIQMAIRSDDPDLDEPINLLLQWALLTADNWTTVSAEIVDIFLQQPGNAQTDIAHQLNIQQSAVSQRLKRASFELLWQLIEFFQHKIRSI